MEAGGGVSFCFLKAKRSGIGVDLGRCCVFLQNPYLAMKQTPPAVCSSSAFVQTDSSCVGRAFVQTASADKAQSIPKSLGGALASSSLATTSMVVGQNNKTKPESIMANVRTKQRTILVTHKKDVVVCPIFHYGPHHLDSEACAGIKTKEGDKGEGSKNIGAVIYPACKVLKSNKGRCRPNVGRTLRINVLGQCV